MRRRLEALGSPEVGGTPGGGVSRPALSDADRRARDLLGEFFTELGLAARIDDLGTMYGRRAGTDPDLAPVLLGSHLDTVVPGGPFDGILGVVAALEVVSLLDGAGISTRHPIDVVNWTAEEGARFAPAMLASGAVAGVHDAEYVRSRTDADGLAFGAELERIGYLGLEANRPVRIHAAFELHIEQGVVLDEAGESVGIVEGIDAVRWYRVTVTGRGEHAGGLPVRSRREAVVAAARMVVTAREHAVSTQGLKVTVGIVNTHPGSVNVVPHTVDFTLDVRSVRDGLLDESAGALSAAFEAIAAAEGVEVSVEQIWRLRPTRFDAGLIGVLDEARTRLGHPGRRMSGGIGHDTTHLARVTRAAMVFTPTVGGLSHCEEESSPWDAIGRAVQVLAHGVLATAE
jgi:N-carbamoyl-L-amino-acid hydrolase